MSVGNQMAAYVPFILAALLVGGAFLGSRLPAALKKVIGRVTVAVLLVGSVALLAWLAWRYPTRRLMPSFFVSLAILFSSLSRLFVRTARARRIFLALGGVLMMGFGFLFSRLLPPPGPVAALEIFRWAMVFCGAVMVAAAWGNWLPPEATDGNEGLVRAASGRPPRHFGDAS